MTPCFFDTDHPATEPAFTERMWLQGAVGEAREVLGAQGFTLAATYAGGAYRASVRRRTSRGEVIIAGRGQHETSVASAILLAVNAAFRSGELDREGV